MKNYPLKRRNLEQNWDLGGQPIGLKDKEEGKGSKRDGEAEL